VKRRGDRIVVIVAGVILLLVGIVFGGQGLGLIPGSFMTGDRTWFYIGLGLAFVGLVLLLIALRRPKSGRAE
jgi:LPXTG-motif cell wall-anchored protein